MFPVHELHLYLKSLTPDKTLWIAYSGGMDSHVLLHVCHQLSLLHNRLQVVHVHHGLHPNADQWANHCQQICQTYQLPLQVIKLNLQPKRGYSLEALAREARYRVLSQCLQPGDYVLTAHHLNDQMETVLLGLLRGSGPQGLAGIAPQRSLGCGYLLRPLLGYSRQALQDYATYQQLHWIEDESNACLDYDRNYIRHIVVPVMQSRWPKAATSVHRAARHCFNLVQLAEASIKQLFEQYYHSDRQCLDISGFQQLSYQQQCQVLRYFFQSQSYPCPSTKQLDHLIKEVIFSAYDKNPALKIGDVMIRRHLQAVYLMSAVSPMMCKDFKCPIILGQPVMLPGRLGRLTMQLVQGSGLKLIERELYWVRFRQGGEQIKPVFCKHRSTLKKLMNAWKIEPWKRAFIPLIFHQERLIAVVGYCVDDDYAATSEEFGYQLSLDKHSD